MTRLIAVAFVTFSSLISTAADFKVGNKVFVKPDVTALISSEIGRPSTMAIQHLQGCQYANKSPSDFVSDNGGTTKITTIRVVGPCNRTCLVSGIWNVRREGWPGLCSEGLTSRFPPLTRLESCHQLVAFLLRDESAAQSHHSCHSVKISLVVSRWIQQPSFLRPLHFASKALAQNPVIQPQDLNKWL